MMTKNFSRRGFLGRSVLATGGALLGGVEGVRAAEGEGAGEMPMVSVFTKHFQGLDFERLADAIVATGVKGVDAPVRKGGHVEPERVEEDLPKLAAVLKDRGLTLTMLTTGINAVNEEQHTEKVLRTAKALGVMHYRMNYFRYDLKKPIWDQVEEWKPAIKDLAALSKEIGIGAMYQNHSGKEYFGAPVWDAYGVLREYPVEQMSFAFDIMHAMIEGGKSWPLELALVKENVGAYYFKNFKPMEGGKFQDCPLKDGVVGKGYVEELKKLKWTGPVSLHVEYLKGSVKEEGYLEKAIAATKGDLATLTEWWGASQG
ncbi:sugar phosphate isomerase/epimerase family protein [Phragmitibacter flavus]|nr:TIM barrel protein [Phragmitibacter flavus]